MKLDVITIGDSMITFNPSAKGPMRYVNTFERKVGGAELNFIIGCSRLGLKAGWISALGKDEFGRYITNFVRGEGIDTSEVQLVEEFPTSLYFKEILEGGSGRSFYYRNNSPTTVITEETLNEEYIKSAKVLHVTGVFAAIDKKNPGVLKKAIKLAKKHGVKICFDPNLRLKLWTLEEAKETLLQILPDVDIVLSGDEEAELLFGKHSLEEYIDIFKGYGISTVILKRGEHGSVGYQDGEIIYADPVKPKIVVDTVGAGDGFNAGFIYSYLNNRGLAKSLNFANLVGSMVVTVSGDNEGLPYLDDVLVRLGEKNQVER